MYGYISGEIKEIEPSYVIYMDLKPKKKKNYF